MHKGINTTMDEGQSMRKSAIIKIRVTPEDKAAFDAVAKARGQKASEILRATVLKVIKRAETARDREVTHEKQ
jgi:antitoxin component of RelBE/YafQ-DinJ toxin-antitoxin module